MRLKSFLNFRLPTIIILFLALTFNFNPLNPLPVSASHTRIWLNGYWTAQPRAINAVAGQPVTVYVMASDVDDPEGLAAFEFKITYDNRYLTLPDQNGDGAVDDPDTLRFYEINQWTTLISQESPEGVRRSRRCSRPHLYPDPENQNLTRARFFCHTIGQEGPGPRGSGVLVSIEFQTTLGKVGTTPLDITSSSLLDVTSDANEIPHSQIDGAALIVKCADLNGNGTVTIGDIGMLVQVFGTTPQSPNWNEKADLDASGSVTVGDIGIAVLQFGQSC